MCIRDSGKRLWDKVSNEYQHGKNLKKKEDGLKAQQCEDI